MALHAPNSYYPAIIDVNAYARNGMLTSGILHRKINEGLIHVVGYRRKACLNFGQQLTAISAGVAANTTTWLGYTRTGYGVSKLVFHMGFAKPDSVLADDPLAYWTVTKVGDVGVDTDKIHINSIIASPGDVPSNFSWSTIKFAVLSNTLYELALKIEQFARPMAACIFELAELPVDDTKTGVADPRVGVGDQILDLHVDDALAVGSDLWKNNGAHLFNWTRKNADASAVTFADITTYQNILDNTTSNTATSQGFRVNVTNRNSISATTVPVTFAVRAERTVGAGTNDVRIIAGDGTVVATVSNFTGAAWKEATGNLATGDQKLDIQARVQAAGNTLRIDAATLFEYTT